MQLCVLIATAATVNAEDRRHTLAPLLSGQKEDLQKRGVALILSPAGLCTGTLVGSREVLTAAHCLEATAPNYYIVVGGEEFGAVAAYYNSAYGYSGGPSVLNHQYDIGILILDREVTGVTPVPIMKDDLPEVNEEAIVMGYGSQDVPLAEGISVLERGRTGAIVIDELLGGMFNSRAHSSSTSLCGGDSGGPVLQQIGDFLAVVGVNSLTTNGYDPTTRTCLASFSGESIYVNLQSVGSERFLSYFPNIQRLSGRLVKFYLGVQQISDNVSAATASNNITKLKKRVSSIWRRVNKLPRVDDPLRRRSISALRRSLASASSSSSTKTAKAKLRSALNQLSKLTGLGIN